MPLKERHPAFIEIGPTIKTVGGFSFQYEKGNVLLSENPMKLTNTGPPELRHTLRMKRSLEATFATKTSVLFWLFDND